MASRCLKCGSFNHNSFDCLRPDPSWKDREPPAVPVSDEPEAAQGPAPEPGPALEKGPWPGAPRLCSSTRLLAFRSERELERFQQRRCPRVQVVSVWTCDSCGALHFKGKGPYVSQDWYSSSDEAYRRATLHQARRLASRTPSEDSAPAAEPEAQPELPRRKVPERPKRPVRVPKAAPGDQATFF